MYTNRLFTALLAAVATVNVYFLLDTSGNLKSTFQVLPVPLSYRYVMLAVFMAIVACAVLWEMVATRILPRIVNRS